MTAGERSAPSSGREPEAAIVEMLERELRLMESDYRRTLEAEPAARADAAQNGYGRAVQARPMPRLRSCELACVCWWRGGIMV